MPRGVSAAKKVVAKKRVTTKVTKTRRAASKRGVVDIPTIARSTLRSSISATPVEGALMSDLRQVAMPPVETLAKTQFIVVNEDGEAYDHCWYDTLDKAIHGAKDACENYMDKNDRDGATFHVCQIVATVDANRPCSPEFKIKRAAPSL